MQFSAGVDTAISIPKIRILVHHDGRVWIKSQPIEDKLKLYTDVRVGKDVNEREDKRLQR